MIVADLNDPSYKNSVLVVSGLVNHVMGLCIYVLRLVSLE